MNWKAVEKRSLPAKALTDKKTRKREVISTSSGFEQLFVTKEGKSLKEILAFYGK
jgi:hypothetical protein